MNIHLLQKRLRAFASDRDWQGVHTPKNLAMAMVVEAAEVLELFQWLTTAQSHTLTRDPADKERISDELADVLIYLLQLADHSGVELEVAVEEKLRKNAIKYPAKHLAEAADEPVAPIELAPKTTQQEVMDAKVHLLVDWENVQPKDADLRTLAPLGTHVWVFHALQQRVNAAWHAAYGDRVTQVPIARPGKNALDFHLSYYIGYISARQPHATFIVISNDKGYDPMLEHARNLGFMATRREFRRAPTVSAKADALVKKIGEAATRVPALSLDKLPTAETIKKNSVAASRPAAVSKSLKTAPAKKAATKKVAGKKVVAAPAVATTPSPPAAPKAAKQTSGPAKKSTSPTSVSAKAVPAGKTPAALTAAQIARRVLAGLAKMTSNKPGSKKALLKVIKSHAGPEGNNDSTAMLVLSLLQAQRQVVIPDTGTAVSYPKLAPPTSAVLLSIP